MKRTKSMFVILTVACLSASLTFLITAHNKECQKLKERNAFISSKQDPEHGKNAMSKHLRDCPSKDSIRNVMLAKAPNGYKALVTGVAGFIGSHVAKDCLELGFDVVGVDDMSGGFRRNIPSGVRFVLGDLKNARFVSDIMQREQFDVVYHLAAYAAEGLSHFIRNYNYQNNLVATTNLITQSVRTGSVKKFVFTSSIATYGSGRTPMTEDMQPLPEDPYGVSKLACEYDLQAAHKMFGMPFVIFRPHNVYGPGQNMYDKYRNVVGIFLNQLQAGKDLTVFGDGTQTRKFSYISDVSFPIAVSGVLDHINNQVFNVGGDIATTVNELASVTTELWGNPDAKVQHLDSRNEVLNAESDHAKLNCFFPGLPHPVGLREGMQKMVAWAKSTGKYFRPIAFHAVEVKREMPRSWQTPGMKEVAAFEHDLKDNVVEASFLTSNVSELGSTSRRFSDYIFHFSPVACSGDSKSKFNSKNFPIAQETIAVKKRTPLSLPSEFKIGCMVYTYHKHYQNIHDQITLSLQYCDSLFIFSDTAWTDPFFPNVTTIVIPDDPSTSGNLWGKLQFMWRYMLEVAWCPPQHALTQTLPKSTCTHFDLLLVHGDDVYMIPENMRHHIAKTFKPSDILHKDIYYGHYIFNAYHSGGGYIVNYNAMMKLNDCKHLKKEHSWAEDKITGQCLQSIHKVIPIKDTATKGNHVINQNSKMILSGETYGMNKYAFLWHYISSNDMYKLDFILRGHTKQRHCI